MIRSLALNLALLALVGCETSEIHNTYVTPSPRYYYPPRTPTGAPTHRQSRHCDRPAI